MMSRTMVAMTAIALACAMPAQAQKFEWTQTQNLPKGQNMPSGIKADILGIELGMSYTEAKAVLERLLAEVPQKAQPQQSLSARMLAESTGSRTQDRANIEEEQMVYTLGPSVQARYVSNMKLVRRLPGSGKGSITDVLQLVLSAPSSGHQVIYVHREVSYSAAEDQPKLSDITSALQKKFDATPLVDGERYTFVFNNGKAVTLTSKDRDSCSTAALFWDRPAEEMARVNARRQCDVFLKVHFSAGISPEHVSSIQFLLSDNERGKSNWAADQTFLNGYLRKLQENTRGAPPKL